MNSVEINLKYLYGILAELRQEINFLNVEAEKLNEIAMNAAVTAGQTGKSLRIYTEISNQIAGSSKKMKNLIDKNRNEVNLILNLTLKILSNNMLSSKFIMVGNDNIIIENKNLINEKISDINLSEKLIIKELISHIYHSKTFLKSILQLQYKLFGIHNCLVIEAIQLEGSSFSAIKTLSESLHSSSEITIYCIDKLFSLLKKILRAAKVIRVNKE
ncbi:hypothetical protein [Silvanigrella aquatica]|uniref:Uncharacterized protein n=1 Tax=Silvanigrella aquatica TaxID=1915309 RepID=A0A1L4D1C2_9BACT|nr:hypothetical protein [Silvanigrella aquatica]APJ04003.1 hypothetical protein AXG55_08825 [Silvanigrella aquatica]